LPVTHSSIHRHTWSVGWGVDLRSSDVTVVATTTRSLTLMMSSFCGWFLVGVGGDDLAVASVGFDLADGRVSVR